MMEVNSTFSKLVFIPLLAILTISCSNNLESQNKKLDEIYGYCDNPQRNIRGMKYTICKDKERAAGPSGVSDEKKPFNISEMLDNFGKGGQQMYSAQPMINKELWLGSLDVTSEFNLKIADSQGGIIQTEWIYDYNINQRCALKLLITSKEIISTGVKTTLMCQQQDENKNWKNTNEDFSIQEKNITLKILEFAQIHKLQSN